MKIFTVSALLPLLLLVRGNEHRYISNNVRLNIHYSFINNPSYIGSDVPGEQKRVGCYYLGTKSERHGTLYPEDLDTSICTHLFYLNGAINNDTNEIIIKSPMPNMKTGGESFVPRLAKLKATNPDLKLILHILMTRNDWLSQEPSGKLNIIQSGVRWLNESGFDGLEISGHAFDTEETVKMADFICDMKNELDKYGYILITSLTGASPTMEQSISKISRCSDHIGLIIHHLERATHRIAPLSIVTPNVDWFLQNGIPANKIVITLSAFGLIFTLENPEDNQMGAAVNGPGNDDDEMIHGLGIRYKDLVRKMNDSSLRWTIRRDNVTKEPYAFTTTRLWTSYEDTTSMEYKAQYVMERGLGGISIVAMDFADNEGIGGEGKFPLTRTVYNAFRRENQVVNTDN